jgi:hypothetical protein
LDWLSPQTTKEAMMMIEAKQSYREHIRAERAAASAQRKADREARYRQSEVICEVRRLALDATKKAIRASATTHSYSFR